ncbi:MAG TPA: hypothetical protein VLZ83_04500 [Edaphocola sp.]|nr:hypothetical protein [Edaphocola sp.]
MSKITAEAIKVVTYLQEQDSHLKDTTGTIYISTEDIATLENLIIHSHKQKLLLELYKKLNNIYEELYTMELSRLCLDSNYYEIEIFKLKQQIKELENE